MEAEGLMCELRKAVTRMQRICHVELEPGYNSKLTFMAHLWQPLPHRCACCRCVCWCGV